MTEREDLFRNKKLMCLGHEKRISSVPWVNCPECKKLVAALVEGLRLAEEIAANSIGARPREIAEAIRAEREKVENT